MKPLNFYKTLAYIKIAGALTVIGVSYQNCSRPHFEVDQLAKTDKVSSETVFGRDPGEDPIRLGESDDRDPGVDPTSCKESSSLKIKFQFECSNIRSEKFGSNLILSSAVKIVIVNKATGNKICEMKGDYRAEIINTKELSLAPCGQLPEGIYSAYILDSDSNSTNYASSSYTKTDIAFRVNSSGGLCLTRNKQVDILYDFNARDNRYSEYVTLFNSGSNSETQTKCDTNKSPLIISMNSQSRGLCRDRKNISSSRSQMRMVR